MNLARIPTAELRAIALAAGKRLSAVILAADGSLGRAIDVARMQNECLRIRMEFEWRFRRQEQHV